MANEKFSLRELQPSDSPALVQLLTEFDGDMTTRFQVDPYAAIIHGTEYRTKGVVVETNGHDGIVGMGTVRFSRVQFNGRVLPFAFLDGLKVRPEYRGRGLGYQIADWRIQQARAEFGKECVIGTGMLHDNHASHGVAAKWCREFAESAFDVRIMPMRTRQPRAISGINVREMETRDYEEFAVGQNAFYKDHNLYTPGDPVAFANAHGISAEGKKPYRFYVAQDSRGNLLAGAQTWARGILKADTINNLPAPIRLLNKVVHLLPPDFTIRDISVNGLWYQAGQFEAARYLWEMLRWLCRAQGTTLVASIDSRDPVMKVTALKPWHQPRPRITLAIHGPSEIERDRLLFSSGRV